MAKKMNSISVVNGCYWSAILIIFEWNVLVVVDIMAVYNKRYGW